MSECVIKLKRKGGFTVLPTAMLRDTRLSLKTKGLFAVMISLPEDWEYSVSGLASINGVGRDAIRSALKEMEEAGYLTRERAHGEGGKFCGNVYLIQEESAIPQPLPENPATVEPSSGFPTSDKPSLDKPSADNPPQYNIDLQNKDLINTPIVPQGGRKQKAHYLPERFEAFYAYYPRQEKKKAAQAAWDKLRPDEALIARMGFALKLQAAYWSAMGTELRFIPLPASWLNGERWSDAPGRYAVPARGREHPGAGGVVELEEVSQW